MADEGYRYTGLKAFTNIPIIPSGDLDFRYDGRKVRDEEMRMEAEEDIDRAVDRIVPDESRSPDEKLMALICASYRKMCCGGLGLMDADKMDRVLEEMEKDDGI